VPRVVTLVRKWVSTNSSRTDSGSPQSSIQPARPQTSAVAEVSGAYQGPQGREATEPVGANFYYQPAHGVAHMSNETADWHRESPQFHRGEDVKDSPSEPADCGGPPSTWSRRRIGLCHEGCATTRAGHCPGRR
jgi:hypothetical protein